MAKLTFYGATEGVTGSAYLIETERATVLMECGLFQGSREEEQANKEPFPFNLNEVDAVVLSHAHLDHSGRLPKLVAEGYSGPVYMTAPTVELLEILHKDAAFLQLRDAQWESKRRRRAGKADIEPLYTIEDVEAALALCEGLPYGRRQPVARGFATVMPVTSWVPRLSNYLLPRKTLKRSWCSPAIWVTAMLRCCAIRRLWKRPMC